MTAGNSTKYGKVKRAAAGLLLMYSSLLVLSFATIAPYRDARAEGVMSTAFNVLVVAPVAIGMLAGNSIYNHMFGDPKPIIAGGGYGSCPFLSDLDDGAFDCQNLNPSAPPWSTTSLPPPGQGGDPRFTSPQQPCALYRRLLACQKGCSEMQKNRIMGYFSTCSGMTQLASPPETPKQAIYGLGSDGGDLMTACSNNQNYRNYVDHMRSCLQVGVAAQLKSCKDCSSLVDNIIHAHTPCNANTGFCNTLGNDPQALKCFGAALGASWQGLGGGHSLSGPARSVGICHMLEQAMTCASTNGTDFYNWWNNMCDGYRKGCEMSGGINCSISCPAKEQLPVLLQLPLALLTKAIASGAGEIPGAISMAEAACQKTIGNEPNF